MNKENVNPDERKIPNAKKDNKSIKEQAINKNSTDGEKINHQVNQKQEKHQPRDNA